MTASQGQTTKYVKKYNKYHNKMSTKKATKNNSYSYIHMHDKNRILISSLNSTTYTAWQIQIPIIMMRTSFKWKIV